MTQPETNEAPETQSVKSRRVHYIAGFDPRGARHYHRLYRDEAAKQARLLGITLEVGERRKVAPHVAAWSVRGEWQGQTVATEYEFMKWDDLVLEDWDANPIKLLGRVFQQYTRYIATGTLRRLKKVSKDAGGAVTVPLFYLFYWAYLLAAFSLIGALLALTLRGGLLTAVAVAAGVAIALGVGGARLGEHLGIFWLMRAHVFILDWAKYSKPALEERIDVMAGRILQEQETSPVDEVLIIGHSVGAILAVAVTARVLEKAGAGQLPPRIELLTLGQAIPMLSLFPAAISIRQCLERLGNDCRIPWTDATIPYDILGCYRLDPVRASGLTPRFPDRPKLTNVTVYQMFSEPDYAKLKKKLLRLHFQCLMAAERPADYDYFRITAGPGKLDLRS